MRIHLHTVCWNDREMLDFFFRHYAWVDRFYLFDDGSTDGTAEYLAARNDVVWAPTVHADPDSWVASAKHIYDTDWKRSRGEADWVVVTNIDEHLHHPDIRTYLAEQTRIGVTAVPALGYQMVSESFPASDSLLWRDCPWGAPWHGMSKLGIYRPDSVVDVSFSPGRHTAELTGDIAIPRRIEVLNLHYKYLGLNRTQARHEAQHERLGVLDRARGWGHKYAWSVGELSADWERLRSRLIDTRLEAAVDAHREHRWWEQAAWRAVPPTGDKTDDHC